MTTPREITKRDCCLSDAVRGEASEYRATEHVAAYREACVGEAMKAERERMIGAFRILVGHTVVRNWHNGLDLIDYDELVTGIDKLRSGT